MSLACTPTDSLVRFGARARPQPEGPFAAPINRPQMTLTHWA